MGLSTGKWTNSNLESSIQGMDRKSNSVDQSNMVIEMTSNDSLHLSETAGFKNKHSAILS